MSLLQIYCRFEYWKNFENRIIVSEVMAKSLVSCFFDSRCTYSYMICWAICLVAYQQSLHYLPKPTCCVINKTCMLDKVYNIISSKSVTEVLSYIRSDKLTTMLKINSRDLLIVLRWHDVSHVVGFLSCLKLAYETTFSFLPPRKATRRVPCVALHASAWH